MKYEFNGGNVLINGEWRQIRDLLHEMDEKEFAVLSAEYEISHFAESHKFCGYCGAATVSAEDEIPYARKCPNHECKGGKNVLYPSYSIASITIAARSGGEEILLGHNTAWPKNRVSLLAGFMQPGETLDECAIREIKEESGLDVVSIRYIKSQTWPFPSNIMVGFYAETAGEARPDGKEIDSVYWVNKKQVAEMCSDTVQDGLFLPKKGSLARKLINLWLSDSL